MVFLVGRCTHISNTPCFVFRGVNEGNLISLPHSPTIIKIFAYDRGREDKPSCRQVCLVIEGAVKCTKRWLSNERKGGIDKGALLLHSTHNGKKMGLVTRSSHAMLLKSQIKQK